MDLRFDLQQQVQPPRIPLSDLTFPFEQRRKETLMKLEAVTVKAALLALRTVSHHQDSFPCIILLVCSMTIILIVILTRYTYPDPPAFAA